MTKKSTIATLADRAMLASVKISLWQARKFDPKVTDKAHKAYRASSDAGRYTKRLIAQDALMNVTKVASQIRAEHHHRTLPWLDGGERLLSVDGHEAFTEKMRELREEWQKAVADFVKDYPTFVKDARSNLNGMFDPADYPDPSEIAEKFGLDVQLLPVPDSKDFRAQVGDDQARIIKQDIERITKEAVGAAVRNTYERISDVVTHMAEKLANYKPDVPKGRRPDGTSAKGVFRDSLVENVRELVDVLPSLNVTADPQIDKIVDRMKNLCATDAAVLRISDKDRETVAKAAAAIAEDIKDYL